MHDPNLRYSMADVRRWAFYNIGAYMTRTDTGIVHGPAHPYRGRLVFLPRPTMDDCPTELRRLYGWDAVPDTRDVRPERPAGMDADPGTDEYAAAVREVWRRK